MAFFVIAAQKEGLCRGKRRMMKDMMELTDLSRSYVYIYIYINIYIYTIYIYIYIQSLEWFFFAFLQKNLEPGLPSALRLCKTLINFLVGHMSQAGSFPQCKIATVRDSAIGVASHRVPRPCVSQRTSSALDRQMPWQPKTEVNAYY